jgi:hypothetical protein
MSRSSQNAFVLRVWKRRLLSLSLSDTVILFLAFVAYSWHLTPDPQDSL